MAQIFVSHSQKDKEIIHFFLEAFAGTKVKPHLEEFEKELPTGVTAQKIDRDIRVSNAIFVLLSENVERLQHTRDWINWECGTARNKAVWVFEPTQTLGQVSVLIPRINHYVLYEKTEEWRKYLREIIDSYDDSHVLTTLSATTFGGAAVVKNDPGSGAAMGFLAGLGALVLKDMTKSQFGVEVRCWKCSSNYRAHRFGRFRCPVCNSFSELVPPKPTQAVDPSAS